MATSVTVVTDNWPRSDGGAGYNPVLFSPMYCAASALAIRHLRRNFRKV